MKKYLVASMLACTALCSSAFAADGVINVTGKVIENACVVNPELNVQMGDVAAATFKDFGDEGPNKAFSLELKDCPANLKTATVQLDGEESAYYELFKLTEGGATGLALRIRGQAPGRKTEILLQEGTNIISFEAVYKAVDKVTAGAANVIIQFSVSYN
ncbi:S-fimbrillin [Serratia marcescens]|uniref:fimbrial protein n=1 Tax=Serratia marcescens TaxID=615 RepID=UPI001159CE61|nr:fimbrial protein [Serratia marcescens]KAB1577838.1 type 1 fimbrial protein [Serratia marcescens]CAI1695524.1 S-fimbrillin [Serratia marcescens]